MSTYYMLGCDKCKRSVPIWGRWVGSCGIIPTAHRHPESVQDFICDHQKCECGIRLFSEHDVARSEYKCYLDDEGGYLGHAAMEAVECPTDVVIDQMPDELRRRVETGPNDMHGMPKVVFGNGEPRRVDIEETVQRLHKQLCQFPWYVRVSWREVSVCSLRILVEVTDKKAFSEADFVALLMGETGGYGVDVKDANDLERFQPSKQKPHDVPAESAVQA